MKVWTGILRAGAGLALAACVATPAFSATLSVDQNDIVCSDVAGAPYCTIGAALGDAIDGDTVEVAPGTYVENVVISEDVILVSTGGRAVTTIQGISSMGALGTVVIEGTTDSAAVRGFTVIGIDNGAPGIENAAIYIRGTHTSTEISDNEVVANGDHGLLSEFGATVTSLLIDSNEFSGQTYLGAMPGGCGFGMQFVTPNVPRQLVTLGGGAGGGNTSGVTFTNNLVSGTAGDTSTVVGCEVNGQGNTLATIDSNGALISGNVFTGQTARFATQLRARGPMTMISGNQFDQDNLIGLACYSLTQEVGDDLGTIDGANSFDRTTLLIPDALATTGLICVNPEGACCTDGPGTDSPCVIDMQDTCEADGGLFVGRGTECDDNLDCEALVVIFESVHVTAGPDGVWVRWTTASEIDTVGFRVLRETAGGRVKRLDSVGSLVPGVGSGLFGASYELLDDSREAARAKHYFIEEVDLFGRVERHGPFVVERGVRTGPGPRSGSRGR